jgi:Meiotically Up-regulated Gene 113 (MUG113) protein
MSRTKNVTGFVYLIRDNDAYKIGKSIAPETRLCAVASEDGELVHVIPSANPFQIENALHRFFAACRRNDLPGREWFNLDLEQVELICSLAKVDSADDLPFSIPPKPGQGRKYEFEPKDRQISVMMDDELTRAFKSHLDSTSPRASRTAVVKLALEEYLQRRGVQVQRSIA